MADLQFNITAVFEQASVAFRQLADDLDTVKKKVDELNAAKGEVSVDDKGIDQAKAKVTELKADVEDLGRARATPEVDPKGIDETKAKVEEVSVDYDALDKKKATPEVDPKGAEPAKLSLDQIFDKMDRLKGERAEPEVDPKVEPAKISLDDIKARIEALKNERADPEITIKTGKAEEQLGAFANKMRLYIQAAIKSLPEVDLTMKLDATDVEVEIQAIRGELAAMQNFVIKGDFDDVEFLAKLRELEAELKALNTEGLTVRAKFDLAATEAQLVAFREKVEQGTELKVDTAKASATIGAFATEMTAKLDAAIKALPDIQINADSSEADRKIAALRAELQSIRDLTVTGHLDDTEMLAKLHELEAQIKSLSAEDMTVRAQFDYAKAAADLAAFRTSVEKKLELNVDTAKASATIGAFAAEMTARLDAAIKSLPQIDIHAESSEADQKIAELRTQLESLRDITVTGHFDDAEMLTRIAELEASLKALSGEAVTVQAKFDYASAAASIAAFRASVEKKLELEVGTDKANAEIGAFATGVKTKLEAAIKSLPDIHITADSTQAEQRMAAVKALLESLKDKRIGIDIDRARFDASMAVINAELTALSGKNIDIPVRVDADSARTALKGIGSDLDEAKGKVTSFSSAIDSFAGLMSTRMGLIGGSIQPVLASIGQLSGALGLLPAIATAVGTGFAAVKIGTEGVSQAIQNFSKIEDLATKATDASAKAQQANATATQASTAAGTGNVAALKQQVTQGQANVDSLKAQGSATAAQKAAIAGAQQQLFGYEAALKNAQVANTGNTSAQNTSAAATKAAQQATTQANSAQNTYNKALEAYKVSLGNLAPAAQQFVMALAGMNQTFKDLKLDVQQHLFEGLAGTLQSLSSGVLPTIRTGLTQMADAINTAVKNVASFVTQQSSVTAWREIFTNVATAATNLAGAIRPILQIITDVTQVGSQFLPGLAGGFANAAQAAADFVSKAKDTGQLAQWIQSGITAVGQLWDVLKNVVAIIAQLATATGFAPSFLQSLVAVTSAIRTLLTDIPGLITLVNAFFAAWVFAKILSGITGMVTSIGLIGTAITGLLTKMGLLTTAETAAGAAAATAGTEITAAGTAATATGAAATGLVGKLTGLLGPLALVATAMAVAFDPKVQGWIAGLMDSLDKLTGATRGADGQITSFGNSTKTAGDYWQGAMGQAKGLGDAINAVPTHHDITFGVDINPATNEILRMDAAAQAAAKKQYLIKFDGNADGVSEAARLATDYAKGVPQPPPSKFTGDASGAQTAAGQAQTAAGSVHQPDPINFLGDPRSILSASGQAVTAANAPPPSHNTEFAGNWGQLHDIVVSAAQGIAGVVKDHNTLFMGDPSQINTTIPSVVSGIGNVVKSWITQFLGDSGPLFGVIGGAQAGITGVPLTHGPTVFTGDPSNLVAGAGQASTAAEGVPLTHGPTVFSADITNLTAGAGEASTSVGTVPSTHPTTLTADPSNLVAGVGTASTAVSGMDPSHNTDLNATDNSTSVIQSIINTLASLVDKTITVTTVYQSVGGAGGMIATPMATGGVVEMASGGELSPNMSGSVAKMIPPNTWRVIGDRMIDDEAFIPINNSAASLAILGEAAIRMGHTLAPMHGGGYWHHGGDSGGGGTPAPPPPQPPGPPSVPIYETASYYATSNVNLGVGKTAAVTQMVTGSQAISASPGNVGLPPISGGGGSGGGTPPVHVHCHFDALGLGDFESSFMTWLRKNVRVQGGDVQRVFG